MSRSMLAEPPELSPYDHHRQQFLTFLKRARGFAEATIINRKHLVGFMAGQISVPDDFDRMGKEEIEQLFGGGVER